MTALSVSKTLVAINLIQDAGAQMRLEMRPPGGYAILAQSAITTAINTTCVCPAPGACWSIEQRRESKQHGYE